MTDATDTYLLLRAFCEELVRCGVTDACTSPGSRSTPIVLSLARTPGLRAWSHIDERVAGFFALGLAKQTGRPVAIACTSGTAAAELAPAVIEAAEARVPLIVLTADRPPELRDVGAGQTIDQIKLYGAAAKWFVEVGTHEATPERVRWMRALACRAVWSSLDGRPGPVHLNMPLREPLVLDAPLPDEDPAPSRADRRPWVAHPVVPAPAELPHVPVAPTPRAVVVAGRDERDPALGEAIAAFAVAAGYPLLADPLSGARRGPAAIAHYDALLRDEHFAAELRPDLVLRIGDLPTSKPLRAWLASVEAEQVTLDAEGVWHDPAGVVSARIAANPRATLAALTPEHRGAGEPAWLDRWREADRAAAGAIAATLGEELSEPRVAAELVDALPSEATLFVAASMPIRDLETFAAARDGAPRILSNRGANGIDGTVAAALGAAAAGDGPVVLHIGDVALAYDLGALLSAQRLGLELTIALVNNDGGGIFDFLPVSREGEEFEHHVATPHGLDFAQAAALYGARHASVPDVAALRAELSRALGSGGVTIVEARTERSRNVALHRRVWDAVAEALRS
ncbi:MAG TPA: 2-succinyl-5-enolpyruvyl-6-hydroxy-3-cyclohexene-1-carboxylic-acid synthase [Conexibacter sp.]|jgi:2-succinyl-5-enolpyruvyl-6-hydroxy-3-cyclohexene-1-carboxylate synthase|nr:2-succinyl-5-enolpyruvyl-6-hydroxy-3-cyclohexene-1-carboxylic-acid synthase [Conexibacter sp.]